MQHNNHMPLLPSQLIHADISNKSLAAFSETTLVTPDVPRVKQTKFLGFVMSLDSPFLVKENILPKLSAAACKKLNFMTYLLFPVTFILGIAVNVTSEESEESISIRI